MFVTGRLAEQPLRQVLASLSPQGDFDYSVAVMPITIAALITPRWLARHLQPPEGITRIMVPGYCLGDLAVVEEAARVPVERGPRDLRQLPEFFGKKGDMGEDGGWDIEVLAEIGDAAQAGIDSIAEWSRAMEDEGADVIVLHGSAEQPWPSLAETVRRLRSEGRRVAVSGGLLRDLEAAVGEGMELLLWPTGRILEAAVDWGCEVVLSAEALGGLDPVAETAERLGRVGAPFRIDPGLRPIGFGLAQSLGEFVAARARWPETPLVMHTGTVTETAGVDSAALNLLLVGVCQELRVGWIVTSARSNCCRTSIRECHLARQLARSVALRHVLPREVESGLLLLRDRRVLEYGSEELDRLASSLKDPSPRIYAERGRLHAVSASSHLESEDPYDLFDRLMTGRDPPLDAAKAFYLGYEMAKAVTALTLGKTYRQDEALDWGMLTVRELTRLERRALRMSRQRGDDCRERERYFEDGDLGKDEGETQ